MSIVRTTEQARGLQRCSTDPCRVCGKGSRLISDHPSLPNRMLVKQRNQTVAGYCHFDGGRFYCEEWKQDVTDQVQWIASVPVGPADEPGAKHCTWALDPDGPGEWWFTTCGEQIHGDVSPNSAHYNLPKTFAFCMYCAKSIRFDRTEHDTEEAKRTAKESSEPTSAPSDTVQSDPPEMQLSRILQAAVKFVDAVGTELRAGIVSRQAPDEWLELSDAVICGRGVVKTGDHSA